MSEVDLRPYVLVVDDDPETRLVVSAALEQIDIEIVAVSDGDAAIGQCIRRDPAVIVLDLALPVLDGVKFAEEYRRLPRSNARIIVLSGTPRGAETAARIRANAYIAKPFAIEGLVAAVRRQLGEGDSA